MLGEPHGQLSPEQRSQFEVKLQDSKNNLALVLNNGDLDFLIRGLGYDVDPDVK